jgi:hypothetical protein
MRNTLDGTKAPKCDIAIGPFLKLGFDDRDRRCDSREILVVDAKLSSKLPHSFDWVEIRTVWREVIKAKCA